LEGNANTLLTDAAQPQVRRRGGETLCRPENLKRPHLSLGPFPLMATNDPQLSWAPQGPIFPLTTSRSSCRRRSRETTTIADRCALGPVGASAAPRQPAPAARGQPSESRQAIRRGPPMAGHLHLVNAQYVPTPRRVRPPAPKHHPSERTTRTLSFGDLIVAIVAGVLAAWITD
jgi:hypothetical protein